jgi:hypothetical protein
MDRAQMLMLMQGLAGRAAPGLGQRLLDLGIYQQPAQMAPGAGAEWLPQPTLDTSATDILAQIEAERRYFGGRKGEDIHSQRNFDRNILRLDSPYSRGVRV